MLEVVSSGALLALTLFASGLVSLLIWFALMLGNPRLLPILRKAVVFFLLPGALMIVIPIVAPGLLIRPIILLGGWVIVAFFLLLILLEEFLKSSASRSEPQPYDKFAFAMLFGIGELMLSKPLTPLIAGSMMGEWSRWGLAGYVAGAMLAMLMHSVTAALYAFRFANSPWLGLFTCFAIHAVYNFLVIAFLNVGVAIVIALVCAALLIALVPDRDHAETAEAAV